MKNTVIFIEENNDFVFSEEFAAFVRESGNYFVLVTRSPLKMLPYSIHEIYEIMLTANGVEEYSKTKLNSFYLQDGIVEKIIEQLPEEILR